MAPQPTPDEAQSWRALLAAKWILPLVVLVGGILMHSMSVLLTTTVLPSVVAEVGGAALMSWAITVYLAAAIVAASCTGWMTASLGARHAYCGGAAFFCGGALLCALAPSMPVIIAGRLLQGLGGGLLSGLSYVLVRNIFPAPLWPRAFGLLSSVWGVSVVVGPLLGGIFAGAGFWPGAFLTIAALAALVSLFALRAVPRELVSATAVRPAVPMLRISLICVAIAALSLAGIIQVPAAKVGLIVTAIAVFFVMISIDRKARVHLLPSDAFSLGSATGVGLWMIVLMSVAYNPFPIFGPILLQRLHGLDPLSAGYVVATQSMSWTLFAMAVAGFSEVWIRRTLWAGPALMAIGLIGISQFLAPGPIWLLVLAIAMVGGGIGAAWAFVVQRIMRGARTGEEDVAAASVATAQQTGFAIGAACAGLVANMSGMSDALLPADLLVATLWIPASFIAVALVAAAMALRLNQLVAGPAGRSAREG